MRERGYAMAGQDDERCGNPECGHPRRWHHGPVQYLGQSGAAVNFPGTARLCCEGSCTCRNYQAVRAEVRAR